MIELLKHQPEEDRDRILALMQREAVPMALMLHLDFASEPLFLCNRNVPFVDKKWGREWGAGAGLLVGLPEIGGGDDQLAPFREYALGMPKDQVSDANALSSSLIELVGDKPEYLDRDAGLYGQFFDPATDRPVGHPFAYDTGLMDRMTASVLPGGQILKLTVESFLARKGVPVYGMQTYFDQKRRFFDDEGMQFVTEAGKLITWTDW